MINVSVMYPNGKDATFNKEYYAESHMPMVSRLLGDALKSSEINFGLGGGMPGEAAPYVAMVHMHFDSVEAFQQAFGPVAKQILDDVPNYTNAQPQVQISQIA